MHENINTGNTILTNKAYLTFVALDDSGKPVAIPPIIPQTEEEREYFKDAEKRRNERLARRKKE